MKVAYVFSKVPSISTPKSIKIGLGVNRKQTGSYLRIYNIGRDKVINNYDHYIHFKSRTRFCKLCQSRRLMFAFACIEDSIQGGLKPFCAYCNIGRLIIPIYHLLALFQGYLGSAVRFLLLGWLSLT